MGESGLVGGLAARPTAIGSSSKLTRTLFFLEAGLRPSSEMTDVVSDASLAGFP